MTARTTIALDDAPGGGARFILEFEVSESAAGLPLRATGEFRAPRMVNGVMVSGAVQAVPRPTNGPLATTGTPPAASSAASPDEPGAPTSAREGDDS